MSSHASIAERVVSRLLEDEAEDGLSADEFMRGYKQGGKIGPIPTEDEVSEFNVLRAVKLLGRYYLVLWDTGNHTGSHNYVGYRLMAGNKVLFQGEDLGVPGHEAIDSDETIRDLIGWLTLKPGDTDDEHFAKYTPEQLAFAESDDAQEIQDMYGKAGSEPDEEGYVAPEAFQNLPGFEHEE